MSKLFFLLLLSIVLHANEYVVIVNKDSHIETVSQLQLKMLFLKKTKIINDMTLIPINLNFSNNARSSFEKNILHMSRKKLKSFWIKQHYFGKRPPIIMRSSKSVLAFIKNIQEAIAYIPKKDLTDDVKVIYKWRD